MFNQAKRTKKINIGIIDDDPNFILLISRVLSAYQEVEFNILFVLNSLTELKDLDDAYYHPDIIICDVNMPAINGIEGLPLLQKRFPTSRILMCSSVRELDVVIQAVRSGAHGFVRKVLSRDEFFNAIFHVMEGSIYISPVFLKNVMEVVQFKVFQFEGLTEREQDIVNGILKGMSYKLVAYKTNVSVNTVRDHIKRIYKKLNINSKGELHALVTNCA